MNLRNTRDMGLAEGCSFAVANREFQSKAVNDEDLLPAIHGSKDPSTKRLQCVCGTKGKDIWMMGGVGTIASFLDEGEIDEFMIHTIPEFICEGIPLIAACSRIVALKLISGVGQAARCGRQVVLVQDGCGQTLNS